MTSPMTYGKLAPFTGHDAPSVTIPADKEQFSLTEFGNAERLVLQHGDDLRFLNGLDQWYCWDGKRFAEDKTKEADRRAKRTVRSLYGEAEQITDDKERGSLLLHAKKSQTHAQVRAMLNLAASKEGISTVPEQFDANAFHFNVENGTIDLRTGDLRPHAREDNISKLASVTYAPDAKCPTWDAFLLRIMDGDAEKVAFLGRAAGYSLTGDVSEQCLFMLHGNGANGKSTFLNAQRFIVGDYGTQADMDAILAKREGGGATPELVALRGARLVTASETNAQTRFNEARLKQLTGGDPITCRQLYGSTFEYPPTFKWWLAFNHKPTLSGDDPAIWRRIYYIPFEVQIPEAERDPRLLERLKTEAPGILAWAVRGCKDWLANGLQAPESVRVATKEYREESDSLGRFLEESCTIQKGAMTPSGTLYGAYKAWAEREGEFPFSQKKFSSSIAERPGITKRKGSGGRRILDGVALTNPPENSRMDDFAPTHAPLIPPQPDGGHIANVLRAAREVLQDGIADRVALRTRALELGVPVEESHKALEKLEDAGMIEPTGNGYRLVEERL